MKSCTGLAEFIEKHFDDDVDRLLFRKSKWPDIDVELAASTILGHRKLRNKVPSWYGNPELVFPSSLCVEQCSSEFTAEAKVKSIRELVTLEGQQGQQGDDVLHGMKIADLTGGLGVDSYIFSKYFGAVFYNEMDPSLACAAEHNFASLGCGNISVSCSAVGPDTGGHCMTAGQLLRDFAPDIIYLDPARRSAAGKKVFRLEDCRPDITRLKDELLQIAGTVAVKLSPMADMDVILKGLGPHCRRLDIVSSGNECKETVAYLDRDFHGECMICAKCSGKAELHFTQAEEASAEASLLRYDDLQDCSYLLEPDKALLKAGAFRLLCKRFGLMMLDRSTHYYIRGDKDIKDDMQEVSSRNGYGTENIFRTYRIIRILPLDRNGIRTAGKEFPCAEVTARNIPMSSEELRRRLGARPSDSCRIFGLKVSFSSGHPAASLLFVTEPLR